MRTAKTLIRLGGCPGWSESSLGATCLFAGFVTRWLKLFHDQSPRKFCGPAGVRTCDSWIEIRLLIQHVLWCAAGRPIWPSKDLPETTGQLLKYSVAWPEFELPTPSQPLIWCAAAWGYLAQQTPTWDHKTATKYSVAWPGLELASPGHG